MDNGVKDLLTKHLVYATSPECPFCGGTMLPLKIVGNGNKLFNAELYDNGIGILRACDLCGTVKFYPKNQKG